MGFTAIRRKAVPVVTGFAIAAGLTLAAGTAVAEDGPASFLDGVWAAGKDCVVQQMLPRDRWTLYTAPDFYTAGGWTGWEASCEFVSSEEVEPGVSWRVTGTCSANGDEPSETVLLFEKLDDDLFSVADIGLVDDADIDNGDAAEAEADTDVDTEDGNDFAEDDSPSELIHQCERLLAAG